MAFRIVTFGDSIPWGQGLLEDEKYDSLIKQALLPSHPEGITIERLAHSDAVIGAFGATGTSESGEVPGSRPSIIEQCDAFVNDPETVDLVLLDGGIKRCRRRDYPARGPRADLGVRGHREDDVEERLGLPGSSRQRDPDPTVARCPERRWHSRP